MATETTTPNFPFNNDVIETDKVDATVSPLAHAILRTAIPALTEAEGVDATDVVGALAKLEPAGTWIASDADFAGALE